MTGLTVGSTSAPPPGSTSAGDLYVDLQSKTVWLGVDPAVDPSGAVLVSDIMSIAPAIAANSTSDRSYTDTQVATRALTVHTHTASQITDFTSAVNAIVGGGSSAFARGMIMIYSGLLSSIGTGALAGWALCDGTNGTPDLRDKFVLGAGNRATGIANTLTSAATDTAAAHNHNVQYHAITQAEMPSHAHYVSGASGSGSGSTDTQGNHQHGNASDGNNFVTAGGSLGSGSGLGYKQTAGTSFAGNHSHNVTVNVSVSGATDVRGSDNGHTHGMDLAGAHSHSVTQAQLREAMPYLTMAYIMKL
jgi:hypothetical protein